ncbi:MAG: transglutaminase-like domain-containing protein [Pseudomonadales bacterium]
MSKPLLFISLLCASAGLGLWLFYLPSSPAEQRAAALAGERWYRLMLEDQQIGYWHTRTYRDYRGNWHFASEQRFALKRNDPVTLRTHRTFARAHPQPLVQAEYVQERRDGVERTHIAGAGSRYQATIDHAGGSTPERQTLDWSYTLDDYLSFEVWLAEHHPAPGTSRTIASLDFDRLDVVTRVFDVVEQNTTGYRIERGSPLADTSIQLDDRFAPWAMTVAGLFDLIRSDRETALAPRSALQSASYFVPADRRVPDHTRASRLVIGIHGHPTPDRLWSQARARNGVWQLTLLANPLTSESVEDHTTAYALPVADPRIIGLAADITRHASGDRTRAEALLAFVHNHLHYLPGSPPRPVLSLLDDPVGDCTDFADMLTTLARARGLESRTVFGLAYTDAATPAFAFHAWNEIRIDGRWQAFDPTWNQQRVDATHIPLPENETAALQLLTGALDLSFSIEEIDYFD